MIKGVISDWDGCLYNSMHAVLKTYSAISGRPFEEISKAYTPNWRKFEKDENVPRVSVEEWNRIFKKHSTTLKLFPGARGCLQRIKADGRKLAIATSANLSRIDRELKRLRLSHVFDAVVTLEDVENIKPDPECLEVAARKLGSKIEECVFVGDTNADASAAKNIGMRFIGVDWGYHPAQIIKKANKEARIVHDFSELYGTIKSFDKPRVR
jgi:HAD superfamily hydrolase (TIGR01509 family)